VAVSKEQFGERFPVDSPLTFNTNLFPKIAVMVVPESQVISTVGDNDVLMVRSKPRQISINGKNLTQWLCDL